MHHKRNIATTLLRCSGIVLGLAASLQAAEWAQWRGPDFNGSSPEVNLPTRWDDQTNLRWVTPLPGIGSATPIIWQDHVFVTASVKADKQVVALALDTRSGDILWQAPLDQDRSTPGQNNMASPSAVTDGKQVWFLTGNGRCAAFTLAGEPVWERNLARDYGPFEAFFGYSSSPLLYDNTLYIPVLRGEKARKRKGNTTDDDRFLDSVLLALDPRTGQTRWSQKRPTDATDQSRESYVTPLPFTQGEKTTIILAGGECVTGHDPATGAERWRWWFQPRDRQKLQHNVPSPVAGEELLYVIRAEHRPLYALRIQDSGELKQEAVAWTYEKNRSWIATPLFYDKRLYVLEENERRLLCFEPKSGKRLWQQELPTKGKFYASPTGADGKIYLISLNGEVLVCAAGDHYRELAHFDLDEAPCRSTIAVADGCLYVRTATKLYCVTQRGG